eukprot:2689905-Pyramimonas_sp.AAC.1
MASVSSSRAMLAQSKSGFKTPFDARRLARISTRVLCPGSCSQGRALRRGGPRCRDGRDVPADVRPQHP